MNLPFDYRKAESERTVIGELLIDPSKVVLELGKLSAEMFLGGREQTIFLKIKECHEKGLLPTTEALGENGVDYVDLAEIMDQTAPGSMEYHIAQLSHALKVRKACKLILEEMADPSDPECVDRMISRILQDNKGAGDFPEWTMRELHERAAERWQKGDDGRKTYHLGIPVVDDYVTLKAGNLVSIIAPPKVGKTWLEVSIASFLATGNRVYFVSAEMHPDDLYTRIASHISKADLTGIEYLGHQAPRRLYEAWGDAMNDILLQRITICKARGMSFPVLKGRILTAINQGFQVIIIDYLQRISYEGAKDERIATLNMSRQLTNMAGQHERLFIVASQAGRAANNAEYTEAHHAKESNAIVEDSDCLLSLTNKTDFENRTNQNDPYKLAINVQQRNGYQGLIFLNFDPRTGQYFKIPNEGNKL